jgi:hypothetical protein
MYPMTTSNRFPFSPFFLAQRRWPRWAIAIAAVLVLHFLAGLWVIHATGPSLVDKQNAQVPVQVALLKPQAVRSTASEHPSQDVQKDAPQAGAAAGAPRKDALQASMGAAPAVTAQAPPKARPHVRDKAARSSLPATAVAQAQAAAALMASATESASSASQTPAAASASTSSSEMASAPSSPGEPAGSNAPVNSNAGSPANTGTGSPGVAARAANAPQGEKFSLPPPSNLHYDSFYNGVQNPTGTIHWATDGSTYQMIVSIPLPFVGTYSYTSEGHVDAYGLAPLRYTEQHGRRGTDVTTFVRDGGAPEPHAAFTRNPTTVELPAGAQDRFSMFMQLSSLVRGDPARYTPGVTREFFVLDNDSGETWPIETVGDENVQTALGFVPARHFTRLPRRAGDQRKVDVWLAPSLGWLPIRFMQTEPNGTQIELRYAGSDTPRASTPAHADAADSNASGTDVSPHADTHTNAGSESHVESGGGGVLDQTRVKP